MTIVTVREWNSEKIVLIRVSDGTCYMVLKHTANRNNYFSYFKQETILQYPIATRYTSPFE